MEKNNKVLVVLVIILCVLVLALGGYIVYDKVLSGSNEDINTNNDVQNENNGSSEENNNENNNDTEANEESNVNNGENDAGVNYNELINTFKEKVNETYQYYNIPAAYCGDSEHSDISMENTGLNYYVSKEFKTYNEMIEYLKKFMSEEVISNKKIFAATEKEQYLEKNGKLYCEASGKGGGYISEGYGLDKIALQINNLTKTKAEAEILFLIIYKDPGSDNVYYMYKVYDTTFEKVNDNWIITSFEEQD